MVEAARHFEYRMPEVFAGYTRERTPFPVAYPTACSPQAWAAGTPVLFLRSMLGLRPDPERDCCTPTRCCRRPARVCSCAAWRRWAGRFDISVQDGQAEVGESG